jgi:hypothetical protein
MARGDGDHRGRDVFGAERVDVFRDQMPPPVSPSGGSWRSRTSFRVACAQAVPLHALPVATRWHRR